MSGRQVDEPFRHPSVVLVTGEQRLLLEALATALTARGVTASWIAPARLAEAAAADAWIIEGRDTARDVVLRAAVPCYLLDLDESSDGKMLDVAAHLGADCGIDDVISSLARPVPRSYVSPRPRPSPLSRREVQVLTHLARGATQESIARDLLVSSQTVRTHVQNAMAKLGAHSRREAVSLAQRRGWLDDHGC